MNTFTHTVLVIGLGWVASFVTVDGQNGIEPLNPALPAGGTADISRGPDGKPAQVVLSNMQRPVLDDMAVDTRPSPDHH